MFCVQVLSCVPHLFHIPIGKDGQHHMKTNESLSTASWHHVTALPSLSVTAHPCTLKLKPHTQTFNQQPPTCDVFNCISSPWNLISDILKWTIKQSKSNLSNKSGWTDGLWACSVNAASAFCRPQLWGLILNYCLFLCVSAGYLYVTCLIQNCSDKMVTAQFLGKIDHNSLLVQDDYIFVKVNNTGVLNGKGKNNSVLDFLQKWVHIHIICLSDSY